MLDRKGVMRMNDQVYEAALWISENKLIAAVAALLTILTPSIAIAIALLRKVRSLKDRSRKLGMSTRELLEENERLSKQIVQLTKSLVEYQDLMSQKSADIEYFKHILPNNTEAMHLLMHDLWKIPDNIYEKSLYKENYKGRSALFEFGKLMTSLIAIEYFVFDRDSPCSRSFLARQILDKYVNHFAKPPISDEIIYRNKIEKEEILFDLKTMERMDLYSDKLYSDAKDAIYTFYMILLDYDLLSTEKTSRNQIQMRSKQKIEEVTSTAFNELHNNGGIQSLIYPNLLSYQILKQNKIERSGKSQTNIFSAFTKDDASKLIECGSLQYDIRRLLMEEFKG